MQYVSYSSCSAYIFWAPCKEPVHKLSGNLLVRPVKDLEIDVEVDVVTVRVPNAELLALWMPLAVIRRASWPVSP